MVPAEPVLIAIEVVYCPRPGVTDSVQIQLPAPATLAQALHASGVLQRHALHVAEVQTGVWCRVRSLDFTLRHLDRVEIYRVLTVDPKEARRLRYRRHRDASPAATAPPQPPPLPSSPSNTA